MTEHVPNCLQSQFVIHYSSLSWIYASKLGCKQEYSGREFFFYWSNQWQLLGGHLKITTLKTNITDPEKFFKIQVIASVFVKQISKGLKLLMIP